MRTAIIRLGDELFSCGRNKKKAANSFLTAVSMGGCQGSRRRMGGTAATATIAGFLLSVVNRDQGMVQWGVGGGCRMGKGGHLF